MAKPGVRPQRVASLIQAELSGLFIREFQDLGAGLLAVTRVEVAPDLKTARVFVSVFAGGDAAAALARLEQRKGHIRHVLASRINLRYNPELFFALDPVPEYEDRLDALMAKSKRHGPGPD